MAVCPFVSQDSDALKDKAETNRGQRSEGFLEPFATAAIAVRTLVACVRPSLCPTHDAEKLRELEKERERVRGRGRECLLSVALDLDEAVLSFVVQGGTLDPANSKSPGVRTVLSTLEMKQFGQYVCVSVTDDSAGVDASDASSSNGNSITTPHAESRLTPNIGSLGVKIFQTVLGPSSCPPFVPTPLRVYALLALVRSTALQRPQVRSVQLRSGPLCPIFYCI